MARATQATVPLRVDGYIRVSKVGKRRGPRFISPRTQTHAIEAWADARDARVVHVFQELDESGARADRPLLEEAIRRCESGESHGVVVHRVDRFGRSLIDGLVAIDRVRRAGGEFFAVHEGLDTTTETGRLVVRILMSVAEWELERIRAGFESARAAAVARGIHGGCVTPVGYRRSRSGRLRPDPVAGPVIGELFRRRAAGEPVRSVARSLEAQGVRTAFGHPGWSPTATGRVFANPVYLGQARCGPYVCDDAHPALTDGPTWEARSTHARRTFAATLPSISSSESSGARAAVCG